MAARTVTSRLSTDISFITNEGDANLLERFKSLIRGTRFFDALVGYFYTSGFHLLCDSLEATERIRILIGIGTGKETTDLITEARRPAQRELGFSHRESADAFAEAVAAELEPPAQDDLIEHGVRKFVEWLRSGKLQIRAYPDANIHAKLYIMTFTEGDRDAGRVITGSSNFSQSGLRDNIEFNVELKNRADYEFALAKFNELWEQSADVGPTYIETVEHKTWLNDTITPYELYLKFLYEYFSDELNQPAGLFQENLPPEFLKLEYQEQAVLNAKRILYEYNGVFLADVVGLGKTYMAAMLAQQLEGRTLVIAPPLLLQVENPGSWPSVFSDFGIHGARFESLGKLDRVLDEDPNRYRNVIVDEAHRFRSEDTLAYEQLAEICRGKRVILVTATPYNNHPFDILALIKLFQPGRRSTIPNVPNLQAFFGQLARRLRKLDRQRDFDEYVRISKENSRGIREKVMRYLTVRRTRGEITRYFSADLQVQGLSFPEVRDPEPVYYQFNADEERVFDETAKLLLHDLKYARYAPMLYYTGSDATQIEKLSEENLRKIMRILMVKRLESSFHAFRLSLQRFIKSCKHYLQALDSGRVVISKKHFSKVIELLEQDDFEAVERLIDEGKAEEYPASAFRPEFRLDLESDLAHLDRIDRLWQTVDRDPKWLEFERRLESDTTLQGGKLIIFTESKETAFYLTGLLEKKYPGRLLTFCGGLSADVKRLVLDNFDARARRPKDDYRILVSTEVLSEGVNLHRSNVVINYDIPWNPTRLMQRVGRVNRVDTKHKEIFTYNFFPTTQSNDHIKLREAAEAKIHAFIALLGADARLLTDAEVVESHELFKRLTSRKTITGEDEDERSELEYLNVIKQIRKENPDLFAHIRRLPKKARTGRAGSVPSLLTFFRRGKLTKFYEADSMGEAQELDFMTAAGKLEATEATPRVNLGSDFHTLLNANRAAFDEATPDEQPEAGAAGSRDPSVQVLRILKIDELRKYQGYTDDDLAYLKLLREQLEEGSISKPTARRLREALESAIQGTPDPLRALGKLKHVLPFDTLSRRTQARAEEKQPREVILSEYFAAE